MLDAATRQFYSRYQQTEEDRAAIREFFDDERRAARGERTVREVSEELTTEGRGRLGHTIMRPFKACSCCGESIPTREDWERLPLVGVQRLADVGLPDLEYRNHPCGSTLAVKVLS